MVRRLENWVSWQQEPFDPLTVWGSYGTWLIFHKLGNSIGDGLQGSTRDCLHRTLRSTRFFNYYPCSSGVSRWHCILTGEGFHLEGSKESWSLWLCRPTVRVQQGCLYHDGLLAIDGTLKPPPRGTVQPPWGADGGVIHNMSVNDTSISFPGRCGARKWTLQDGLFSFLVLNYGFLISLIDFSWCLLNLHFVLIFLCLSHSLCP